MGIVVWSVSAEERITRKGSGGGRDPEEEEEERTIVLMIYPLYNRRHL